MKPSLTKDSEFWLYEGAVLGAGSAFALITTGAWDEGELLFTESFLVVRQFGREGFEAMRYTFKPGAVKVAHARIGLRDYMLNGWVQGRLEEHLLSWRKQNPSGDYPRPYKLREANPSVSALRVREAFRREGLEVIRANTSSTLLRRYVAMVCALDELVPEPFGS